MCREVAIASQIQLLGVQNFITYHTARLSGVSSEDGRFDTELCISEGADADVAATMEPSADRTTDNGRATLFGRKKLYSDFRILRKQDAECAPMTSSHVALKCASTSKLGETSSNTK